MSQDGPTRPAESLELVFGPEDGRRITLQPKEVLGREKAGSTAQHPLYVGHAAIDNNLRSDHLTWLGPGALLLRSSKIPTLYGEPRPVKGPTSLREGELIWLTMSTWIVGRA